jgi:hypothetical protein
MLRVRIADSVKKSRKRISACPREFTTSADTTN